MATMDSLRFDALTRTVSTSGTRRGVLRLMAALPVAGTLAALLGDGAEAAAQKDPERGGSHRRRKRKRRHDPGEDKDNRKGKRKGKGKGKGKRRKQDPGQTPPPAPAGQASCRPGGCAAGQLCDGGSCRVCDVCPSGCAYSSVQAALDAASDGATIRLCPGTYDGDLDITRNVTLIGAGDEADPATNTILDAAGSGRVVTVYDGNLTLQSVRITGGRAGEYNGGGIFNGTGTLALIDTTVTGNTADHGGGIHNIFGGTVTLSDSTVSGNEAARGGGGIYTQLGTVTINAASRVTGNTAPVGGGIYTQLGTVTIDATSEVTGNMADPGLGGGIYNSRGTVTLASDQIVTNNCRDNCASFTSDPVANCAATPVSCPSP